MSLGVTSSSDTEQSSAYKVVQHAADGSVDPPVVRHGPHIPWPLAQYFAFSACSKQRTDIESTGRERERTVEDFAK